ncbi:NAD(P)-binding protein [Lophiostoma macrostomum CBS 122681]|uniref:NAD(P)-binding protein n=1 Tax=Lophiostoma macrostomum CBS 122681 TaxID=1314788 RepID=A0A6A6SHL3_9PLEO|nr:NAD(P)-binding protein [Lophiostoma macrostomum CBS 122681]
MSSEPDSKTTPTVFLTGATGFVGGTILSCLSKTHPNIRIKALIREERAAKELQSVYSNLIPIIGDLSSLSLLTSTAAEADFVIHAGGDNVAAVCAMIDGLVPRTTTGSPLPRLISLTGPRSLIDLSKPITGNLRASSRPWSDITDAHTILNVPEDRIHAGADQAIVAHSTAKGVGTMLVSPGQLWGRGKGHLKKESNATFYYATVKKRGRAFVIGEGSATWSWVSIGDLGDAVVFLMGQALESGSEGRGKVGVNRDGYYFVRTGDLSMIERAKAVSGRLGLGEVESMSVDSAREIHPFGPIMWGCGERTRSDKLLELGWRPKETDWKALMEEKGGERA